MAQVDTKQWKKEITICLAASVWLFWLGDRWGMVAEQSKDMFGSLFGDALLETPIAIVRDPFGFSFGAVPLLCGVMLFVIVWIFYVYLLGRRQNIRFGDEYGTARKGTIAEGQMFKDMKDPENNIILTKHLGIAIKNTPAVQQKITARNVCVIGGTGSNKTTGFVMPNLLQFGAHRDIVVVDPKGTTLATCGHALVTHGIDIRVFNSVNKELSDMYNPLANIKDYAGIADFVTCLVQNTNNGKSSNDPIWDNGEILFYRALLTLMLDYGNPKDMTFARMVELADMCDIKEEGEGGGKSPLDLIFDEIETGWKIQPKKAQQKSEPKKVGRAYQTARHVAQFERVATKLVRRDGLCPYDHVHKDGSRGFTAGEDEALKLWHEFRHGAGKTLKSFVISSHTRLAYLSQPDVLRILSSEDGHDDIHLELLGQTHDEMGNSLHPRVVFVVSSDFNANLNALLSIMMWQAIFLPMSSADKRNKGALPRPVSLIFDEFRNIGKLGSFVQTIAVVRSRNIDVAIMLQSLSQIDELYGENDAKTIRENAPTTMFLGGGRATSSAKVISEEAGKETAYKYDWSRSGDFIGGSQTRSKNSLQRDVYDVNEVATLSQKKALVMMGDKQVIEDDKSVVWEHPNYEETYMGISPERSFDYVAWREAGRPLEDDALVWEEAYFEHELPATQRLAEARQAATIAQARLYQTSEDVASIDAAYKQTRAENMETAHEISSLASRRVYDYRRRALDGEKSKEEQLAEKREELSRSGAKCRKLLMEKVKASDALKVAEKEHSIALELLALAESELAVAKERTHAIAQGRDPDVDTMADQEAEQKSINESLANLRAELALAKRDAGIEDEGGEESGKPAAA